MSKILILLKSVPEKDPRYHQLEKLLKYLIGKGLDLAPASTGANYLYGGGNYEGGLVDHMLIVHTILLSMTKAIQFKELPAIAPASLVIVAVGHVAYKVDDGYGHPYYMRKILASGKPSKNPYEGNPEYADIPPSAINLQLVGRDVHLEKDEAQALAVALDQEHRTFELPISALSVYLRAAYLLSTRFCETKKDTTQA